jgi:putative transposase
LGWALPIATQQPLTRADITVSDHYNSFAWLSQQRRLSKEYERTTKSSESMIKIAAIRLMLRRLTMNAVRTIAAAPIF